MASDLNHRLSALHEPIRIFESSHASVF